VRNDRIQIAVLDLEFGKPGLQGFNVFIGMHTRMLSARVVFSKQVPLCC
jgi:hypothetical protein